MDYAAMSRADRLTLGTVNASTVVAVTADEIAAWIREERASEPLHRNALLAFFLEVPLSVQVAFLVGHALDETQALALAERLELLGRPIPLAARRVW